MLNRVSVPRSWALEYANLDEQMVGRGLQDENNSRSASTESREAFFLDFATQARKRFPDQILMLTGGFRTRKGIESALQSGVCDLVGIGRPAVLNADFPRLMMDDTVYSDQAKVVFSKVQAPFFAKLLSIKVLGGGAETVSYANTRNLWTWFKFSDLS